MAAKFEVEFPKQKGWYSLSELKYLSNSLGFDSSVFTKVIFSETKCLGPKGLSEKKFIEMLNLKMFDKYLDGTFNNKSAKYNVRTIKKSLQLLRHKVIGFPELSQARIAYFLYENDDQLGMDADSGNILKALKLCDRIMSPVQLDKYLIDVSLSVQIPCRLQLFEFLELMSLTMRIDGIPMTMFTKEKNADYFQVIQTKEQRAMDILDQQFRDTQSVDKVVKDKQKTTSAVSALSLVNNTEYDSVVSVAQDQCAELLSSVEISTAHLRSARSGHVFLSSSQLQDDTRASTSLSFGHLAKETRQRQGLKFQFRKLPLREVWHHKESGSNDTKECTQECAHHHKQSGHKFLQEANRPTTRDQNTKTTTENVTNSFNLQSKPWPSITSAAQPNNGNSRKIYFNMSAHTATSNGIPFHAPLITKDEFNNQQYRMDDLKWDMLRKETTRAKLKHCTLPSSVSASNAKPNGYKFATLPITDAHTVSMTTLKVLNQHDQKPTTKPFFRSKSNN